MSNEAPQVSTLMSLAKDGSLIGRTLVVYAQAAGQDDLYPAGATLHGAIEGIDIIDNQGDRNLLGIRLRQLEIRDFSNYQEPEWKPIPGGEHYTFTIDDRAGSASYLRTGAVGVNYPFHWHGTIELPEENIPDT